MEEKKWYPVYTNPRAEKRAHELLSAKGIESYLPLRKTLKQWSDRKKWIDEPLIPSYLFVNINAKQHAEVLMTNGVCRFLYFSGKIASMPERQIEALKLLLASEEDIELTDREFEKGEEIIINAGPLKGLKGELISRSSRKKLLIRIDHVGQSVVVQLPAAFVE
ncbi:UpxY family transcription antiterminator [Pedobacter sp. HMF7647]|uniref:UpxY family transcription antiterminator n=1 Tax=Hufsiella arboris TaxID=2695275 RepID=A0A7K1YE08_9SPHI|nr:UpxY family transcription antiterminator [Hufsiella arboris]